MEVADPRTRRRARSLRRRQTQAEAALWSLLRGRALGGLKFRRQAALGRFTVDFVCLEARLVIEADGGVHRLREAEDTARDAWLQAQDFTVLRFNNTQILSDPNAVLQTILTAARRRLSEPG